MRGALVGATEPKYSMVTSFFWHLATHAGTRLPSTTTSQTRQWPSMHEYFIGMPDCRATSASFCPCANAAGGGLGVSSVRGTEPRVRVAQAAECVS